MLAIFSQEPSLISRRWHKTTLPLLLAQPNFSGRCSTSSFSARCSFSISVPKRALRYAVLGAGFAGLSVAWHLLQHGSKEIHLCVDIYDEVGVGGGASGVAGGLLHPYSPKVKLLWRGSECWKESLNLINVAEDAFLKLAKKGERETPQNRETQIVRRN